MASLLETYLSGNLDLVGTIADIGPGIVHPGQRSITSPKNPMALAHIPNACGRKYVIVNKLLSIYLIYPRERILMDLPVPKAMVKNKVIYSYSLHRKTQ